MPTAQEIFSHGFPFERFPPERRCIRTIRTMQGVIEETGSDELAHAVYADADATIPFNQFGKQAIILWAVLSRRTILLELLVDASGIRCSSADTGFAPSAGMLILRSCVDIGYNDAVNILLRMGLADYLEHSTDDFVMTRSFENPTVGFIAWLHECTFPMNKILNGPGAVDRIARMSKDVINYLVDINAHVDPVTAVYSADDKFNMMVFQYNHENPERYLKIMLDGADPSVLFLAASASNDKPGWIMQMPEPVITQIIAMGSYQKDGVYTAHPFFLQRVIRIGTFDQVNTLIRAGADVHYQNGYSALLAACAAVNQPRQLDIVKLLIEKGCRPIGTIAGYRFPDMNFAACVFSETGPFTNREVVEFIVSHGACLDDDSGNGHIPESGVVLKKFIFWARPVSIASLYAALRWMLDMPNLGFNPRGSPEAVLFIMTKMTEASLQMCCQLFLDLGIPIDVMTPDGNTPLTAFLAKGDIAAVNMLYNVFELRRVTVTPALQTTIVDNMHIDSINWMIAHRLWDDSLPPVDSLGTYLSNVVRTGNLNLIDAILRTHPNITSPAARMVLWDSLYGTPHNEQVFQFLFDRGVDVVDRNAWTTRFANVAWDRRTLHLVITLVRKGLPLVGIPPATRARMPQWVVRQLLHLGLPNPDNIPYRQNDKRNEMVQCLQELTAHLPGNDPSVWEHLVGSYIAIRPGGERRVEDAIIARAAEANAKTYAPPETARSTKERRV